MTSSLSTDTSSSFSLKMDITIVSGVIENIPVQIFSLICQLLFLSLDDVIPVNWHLVNIFGLNGHYHPVQRHQKHTCVNFQLNPSTFEFCHLNDVTPVNWHLVNIFGPNGHHHRVRRHRKYTCVNFQLNPTILTFVTLMTSLLSPLLPCHLSRPILTLIQILTLTLIVIIALTLALTLVLTLTLIPTLISNPWP